jgi:quercetin dioxygenase-like cupin family protein
MKENPKAPHAPAAARAAGPLGATMLSFDLKAEIEQLRAEDAWRTGHNSKTLVKHAGMRVVLMALKSKARLNEHKAAGEISVETIQGHIRMHVQDQIFDLPAGQLLALDREVVHDVEAIEDSAFLLTIAWPQGSAKD